MNDVERDLSRLQTRVNRAALSLAQIAEQSGVGYSWLRMFARGEIPDPSYRRIRALQEWARSRRRKPPPLELDQCS